MNEKRNAADLDAMRVVVHVTAARLHAITSRTDPERIASEALRLNDAVRAAAAHRLPCSDPPGNFLQALVQLADDSNGIAP